jgi:3-isopropylmalate/(R)-2-methylmalate dehydratase small subunit
MTIHGAAHVYGDNVDTDVIIPARYLNTMVVAELAAHCLEDLDREFVARVRPGDLVVGGKNFGCGSSREQAPLALQGAGVGAMIAESFARIFYRNAINIGLPLFVCPEAAHATRPGDSLEVDLDTGEIRNLTQGQTFRAQPFPEFVQRIIAAGGLIPYTREKLGL